MPLYAYPTIVNLYNGTRQAAIDSTSNLAVALFNGNNEAAVDSSGRLTTVPTVGGSAISASNPLPISDVGGAVTLIEQSATINAAASGTCTLAGTSGKTTYIRGFTISSAAAVAIVSGLVTLTGLTNTMNFYYDNLAVGQSGLFVFFGEDGIPASAANTGIVVNFPAITGGAATAINVWGYQL